MKRKTVDVLVPIIYVLAIAVAIVIGDPAGVGGVALIGAVCVIAYFSTLRQGLRAAPNDPPGHPQP